MLLPHTTVADTYDTVTQLGSSARHIAIGNIDGFSYGSDSIFENPAALYRVNNYSLNLFSSSTLWDTAHNSISFASELSEKSTLSIGIYELSMTDFEHTDDSINQLFEGGRGKWYALSQGTFQLKQEVLKVAYQYSPSETTHIGITSTTYTHKMLDYLGKGWDIDLGIITEVKQFEISASIKNALGNNMNFNNNASEKLPRQFQISTGIPFKGLYLLPQLSYQNNTLLYSTGLEYQPNFLPNLTIMGGYKSTLNNANKKATRWSTGINIDLDVITVSYAYEKGDVVTATNQHYFSIEIAI